MRLKIEEIAIFGDSCPKGHAMEEAITRDGATACGVCLKTQPKGVTMHICAPCDYNVCAACFQSEGGGRQPATKPKLVRTQSNAAMARADPANGVVFELSRASAAMCKNLFDGLDVECDEYLTASARPTSFVCCAFLLLSSLPTHSHRIATTQHVLFCQAFARKSDSHAQREAFSELCRFFDPDHDGKITLDEMTEGLRNLGHHFIAHDAPIQREVNQHIRAQVATFVQHDVALQASVREHVAAAKAAHAAAAAHSKNDKGGGGGCVKLLVRALLLALVVFGALLAYRCAALQRATGRWPDDVATVASGELQRVAAAARGLAARAMAAAGGSQGGDDGKGEL